MNKVILWIHKHKNNRDNRFHTYIKETANTYGINVHFVSTPEEIKNSDVKLVFAKRQLPPAIREALTEKTLLNPLDIVDIINDKVKTKEHITVKVGEKYLLKTYSSAEEIVSFPVIVKDKCGTKGDGIFLVHCKEELYGITDEYFIEEYGGEDITKSSDYRVYVLNGKILVSIQRTNEGFISNVDKGGKVSILPSIEENILEQLNKIIKSFDAKYFAIDYIVKNGEVKVLELNTNPGASALLGQNFDYYTLLFKGLSEVME